MMQGIMDLHHDIFFFLILILVFVLRIGIICKMEMGRGSTRARTCQSSSLDSPSGSGRPPKKEKRTEPEKRREPNYSILIEGRMNSLIRDLQEIQKTSLSSPAPTRHQWKRALVQLMGNGSLKDQHERLVQFHSQITEGSTLLDANCPAFQHIYQIVKALD